ncbi:hypothetical protein VNI00_007838 [Paramarasmius palmivorus]|uniref:F-box domain-containing protein n=1 Tax=Paramarasmius palmivorus TaxID=297713 RepID=A0AAW0D017_9AGAR
MESTAGEKLSLTQTEQRLDDLKRRKAKLLTQVEEIDIEIKREQQRHAVLVNEAAPISKLPPELLSNIFLTVYDDDTSHHLPKSSENFQILASHVCSSWRRVAIGTPLLWSDIHVKVSFTSRKINTVSHSLHRLISFLERSGTSLFHFTLDVNGAFDMSPFFRHLHAHLYRCYTLFFRITNHPTPVDVLLQHLGHISVPILDSLTVQIPRCKLFRHDETQFIIIKPSMFRLGAPALQSLRLTGIAGPLQPPLGNITTLHLQGTDMGGLSPAQFLAVLENTPLLINLSLDDVFVHMEGGVSPDAPASLVPHLHSLRVRCPEHCELRHLLSLLPLSQLRSVCLSQIETFRPIEFPNATSLILECPISTEDIGNLILAFPLLTSLTLVSNPEVVFVALGFPGEPAWWPKLTRLCVKDLQKSDVAGFMGMLQRRKAMGTPLEALTIDGRDRMLLRKHWKEITELVPSVLEDSTEPWPAGHGYDDADDGFWSMR